jgi:Ring finger domain
MSFKRKYEIYYKKEECFQQEKPEDCIICTEKMDEKNPLECGHWIHIECVRKHFKPECPICRKRLNMTVTGVLPGIEIPEQDDVVEPAPAPAPAYWVIGNMRFTVTRLVIEPEVVEPEQKEEVDYIDLSPPVDYGLEENDESWKEKGYNYPDEDEDYDEENPTGDNVNYD